MKASYLESERLYYEPLSTLYSSNSYVDWLNDEEVNKYLESGGGYTIEKLNVFLKEQESKNIQFWAIVIKESNKHIGNIKIDPIKNSIGEYGILIGDKIEWGKGYAKEASETIIHHCFDNLKLTEIQLGVKPNNINAIKLYKTLGFEVYDFNENNISVRMKIKSKVK